MTVGGTLYLGPRGERNLYATSCVVEGTAPPPAPIDLSIAQILSGHGQHTLVRTAGTLVDAYLDDVDARFLRIVIFSNGLSIDASICTDEPIDSEFYTLERLRRLINAEIRILGTCGKQGNWRRFTRPGIGNVRGLEVLRPPPPTPFDVPSIDDHSHSAPAATTCGERRTASGLVVAVWETDEFLLKTRHGFFFQVHLAKGTQPPAFSESVTVAALVDSDGSNLILRDAVWKHRQPMNVPPDVCTDVDARDLFLDRNGKRAIQYDFYGKLVRLRGEVLTVQRPGALGAQLLIKCDEFIIPVNAGGCPQAIVGMNVGSEISVAGICLIDFENWRQGAPFPRIHGIQLVLRKPEDVRILSRPSPLTAGVLAVIVGILLLVIVGFVTWNRLLKKLIVRKSRELFRSQIENAESQLRIEERTRLAAELHDYTAQNLAAVSYQIAAAQSAQAVGSGEASEHLDNAERMLHSCRTELRRCLWDLKTDALDDPDFAEAIRKTVASVSRDAIVSIRFPAKRAAISDTTAHAVLSIVRELVSNAIRHGCASYVRIAGEMHDGALSFSVRDNGRGFDPNASLGQTEGHFGLSGIADRIKRLQGQFRIDSAPGRGTHARATIHIGKPATERQPS